MFCFLYIFPSPTPIPKKYMSCQEKNPWSNVGVSDERETNEGYSVGHIFFSRNPSNCLNKLQNSVDHLEDHYIRLFYNTSFKIEFKRILKG